MQDVDEMSEETLWYCSQSRNKCKNKCRSKLYDVLFSINMGLTEKVIIYWKVIKIKERNFSNIFHVPGLSNKKYKTLDLVKCENVQT